MLQSLPQHAFVVAPGSIYLPDILEIMRHFGVEELHQLVHDCPVCFHLWRLCAGKFRPLIAARAYGPKQCS